MTDPNVSPYLQKPVRTKEEALADLVPPIEVPSPRDHQPVIDRHMNKPDAVLWRARDEELSIAKFCRDQVRLMRRMDPAIPLTEPDMNHIRWCRGRHTKAIATARAYDVLIAERDATRRVLG